MKHWVIKINKLEKRDLEGCHRISVGNNGVIIKFVNGKMPMNVLTYCMSNLKDINKELI